MKTTKFLAILIIAFLTTKHANGQCDCDYTFTISWASQVEPGETYSVVWYYNTEDNLSSGMTNTVHSIEIPAQVGQTFTLNDVPCDRVMGVYMHTFPSQVSKGHDVLSVTGGYTYDCGNGPVTTDFGLGPVFGDNAGLLIKADGGQQFIRKTETYDKVIRSELFDFFPLHMRFTN